MSPHFWWLSLLSILPAVETPVELYFFGRLNHSLLRPIIFKLRMREAKILPFREKIGGVIIGLNSSNFFLFRSEYDGYCFYMMPSI